MKDMFVIKKNHIY